MFPLPIKPRLLLLIAPFALTAAETDQLTARFKKHIYDISKKRAVYRETTGRHSVADAEKAMKLSKGTPA